MKKEAYLKREIHEIVSNDNPAGEIKDVYTDEYQ